MTERHYLLKTYFTHLSSEVMLPWNVYNMFTLCLFLCIIDCLERAGRTRYRVLLVYIFSSVIHSCFLKVYYSLCPTTVLCQFATRFLVVT